MTNHTYHEKIIVNSNIETTYETIANVENYPNIIPWIKQVQLLNSYDNIKEYELTVKFSVFSENFSTKDIFYPNEKIDVSLISGPFKHLNNIWEFKNLSNNTTEVSFYIDFEFKSKLLNISFSKIFLEAQKKIFSGFIKQL